jgi:uncharacterized protein (TIGR03067 family)
MHFGRGGMGLVAGCVLAAAAGLWADDAAVQKDLKHLEGEWSYKDENGGEVTYKFKGDTLSVRAPNRSYRMTVKLNPAANPEKTIDFHVDEGPEDAKGKTSKGIYKFEGDDILIFCICPEGDRPTKYEQSGSGQILSTLKRKKS